jgi:hypothetical protein
VLGDGKETYIGSQNTFSAALDVQDHCSMTVAKQWNCYLQEGPFSYFLICHDSLVINIFVKELHALYV